MVALTLRFQNRWLNIVSVIFIALFTLSPYSVLSNVVAQTDELNIDSMYMALTSRRAILTNREDSLSKLLATYRKVFATGEAQTAQNKDAVISIEMELFDTRSEQNTINTQIVSIEKLRGGAKSPSSTNATESKSIDDAKSITKSRLAQESIPQQDYSNLLRAELIEAECAKIYEEYIAGYNRMLELLQLYNQTDDEEIAISYQDEFYTLLEETNSLANSMQSYWGNAYDNKDFAYKMLMEVMGDEGMLNKFEEMARECEAQITTIESGSKNNIIVRYNLQKRNIVDIERLVAERLQLKNAVDSLNVAAQKLSKMTTLEQLPELVLIERNFILYEPIVFSTAPVYNASNPIPETAIYNKGTIYRVAYGAFSTNQSPSIFHGASPLSYERSSDLWRYYGGGYATYSEAEAAAVLCKQKGFKRPEVVMWRDGESRNLARDPLPMDKKYRVQIMGLTELTEEVKSVIDIHCPESELSKVGADCYIIGTLEGEIRTLDFTNALKSANRSITTNIIEIE
ncbi:MAG: hypothetical protein SNH55_08145 [Rikenellaceae bacterium]